MLIDLWTFFWAVITQWVWLVTSSLAAGILFYFPELRSRVERIVGPGRLILFGFIVATYFAWIQEHRARLAADLRWPASVAEQMATLKAQQERRLREEWQPIEGRTRQALVDALSEHPWDEPAKVAIVDNGSLDCLGVALDLDRVFEAAGWSRWSSHWACLSWHLDEDRRYSEGSRTRDQRSLVSSFGSAGCSGRPVLNFSARPETGKWPFFWHETSKSSRHDWPTGVIVSIFRLLLGKGIDGALFSGGPMQTLRFLSLSWPALRRLLP